MKFYLIAALFVLLCSNGFSQNATKTADEYFILGTLSDYMGREKDPRITNHVDYYYHYEKSLALYVDSLLKKDHPGVTIEFQTQTKRYNIYSADIAAIFDNYYDFKPSGSSTLNGEPILMGVIKTGIFSSDEQKLAFLAGCYARYKDDNDTSWCIHIANSVSKARTCFELLKQLNCKANYVIWSNYIPVGHVVYFHPTKRVAAYLKKYGYIKDQANKDMQLMTDSLMSNGSRKKRGTSPIN